MFGLYTEGGSNPVQGGCLSAVPLMISDQSGVPREDKLREMYCAKKRKSQNNPSRNGRGGLPKVTS